MTIDIVAATEQELAPLTAWCMQNCEAGTAKHSYVLGKFQIKLSIHGVGLLAAAYHIQKICSTQPSLILQAGIGGAFSDIGMAEVYRIESDCLADFGVDDRGNFVSAFSMGLANPDQFPFSKAQLSGHPNTPSYFASLRGAKGATVQKVSGEHSSIQQLLKSYAVEVESMEGAALHYVCTMENIPFLQLRSISNRVENRDTTKWKIKEAIDALNEVLINYLQQLQNMNEF